MKLSISNLFYAFFALLVCSLYLPPVFYTLFTAALVILAGVALGTKDYSLNLKSPLPWLYVGFLAVHFTGFFLGGESKNIMAGIQPKLSFLFLPFVLAVFHTLLTRSFFRKLIAAFFFSSVLICLIFLMISVFKACDSYGNLTDEIQKENFRWFGFFYSSVLTHDYIHRSYLGLMLGAALISSPFIKPIKAGKQFLFFAGIAIISVVLFLLQSRMILIALAVSLLIYAIITIIKMRSVKWAAYLGIGLAGLGVVAYLFADSPYNRFNNMKVEEYDMSDKKGSFTGSTIRFAIWENSLDIIREHPVFGVGYGAINEVRLDTYQENEFEVGVGREYNSHNQFLETQVIAGVLGSVMLLGMFAMLFFIAWQRGDAHLFTLALFMLLSMLTEAMFERQWAVSFFCTYILAMALGEKVAFKKERPL